MTAESFARQNAGDRLFAGLAGRSTPLPHVVTLPWPDAILSPNARPHWAPKAKAVKMARLDTAWSVRAAFVTRPHWSHAVVSLTFNPPDRRRRDLQNCIASAKALVDGIADALGIDDSKFDCRYVMGEPVKGGAVRVEIRPI